MDLKGRGQLFQSKGPLEDKLHWGCGVGYSHFSSGFLSNFSDNNYDDDNDTFYLKAPFNDTQGQRFLMSLCVLDYFTIIVFPRQGDQPVTVSAAPASIVITCPPGGAAALVRLGTVGLAHAAVLARQADAGVVDLRLAEMVGEAQSAGAAEVHRVALEDGATGAAAQARRADARVRKLTPAPDVFDRAPEGRKMEMSLIRNQVTVVTLIGSNKWLLQVIRQ